MVSLSALSSSKVLSLSIVVICLFSACKKNETGPESLLFDPAFVGVWYASSDSVGFEVASDGSSKTLIVDTAGTLQYTTAGSGTTGAISLTLISGNSGNLMANLRYHVPGFIDTTIAIPGTYVFSNSNNTLSITFPNPLSPGQTKVLVFQRSSIGAVVRPRSSFAALSRRWKPTNVANNSSRLFGWLVSN